MPAPVWSLFPKLYRDFGATQLADLVSASGLDTTNVVVRSGYLVEEETLAQTLPKFLGELRRTGLKVVHASTTYSSEVLAGEDSPIKLLADCGIQEFRMGWFPKAGQSARDALRKAKGEMDRVAEACAKHRIRAIYQVHHNTLITSASAAFNLVNGLPAEWIGVELDPGNQSFQGFEPWDYSVSLLGDYCAWLALKDTVTWREDSLAKEDDKGWRRNFSMLSDGVTNWVRLAEALTANSFDGTFVFMPFYDEEDERARTEKLKADVAYFRDIWNRPSAG